MADSDKRKRIHELKKILKSVDGQIRLTFKQAKDFAKKGEAGKSTQAQTRWAILIDKRKIINKDLDDLLVQGEEDGDQTLKFSCETARRFYRWLMIEDAGYLRWCWIHKFHENRVNEILKTAEKVPEEQMVKDLGEQIMKEIFGKNTEKVTGNLEDLEGRKK